MGRNISKLSRANFNNTPTFTLADKKCNVKVLKVYCGDTLWIAVNLYNTILKFKVRMIGYDSPKLHPLLDKPNRNDEIKAAAEAIEYLESLIMDKFVYAEFYKYDKHGIPLCNLYIDDPSKSCIPCPNRVCVNTLMIRNNHGCPYMGAIKKNIN